MTREEAVALLERYSNYDGMGIPNLAGCKEAMKVAAEALKEAYPELAESEDERIRKRLIEYFEGFRIGNAKVKWEGLTVQDVLAWLEKQKEQIPYTDFVIKPHKGDDNNPYDMRVSEAQEYAIKRGFGIPYNDGEVYIDERHMTQTIGNILRWADEHPKEQKSAESISQLTVQGKGVYKICPRCKERMVRDDSMVYTSMPPQYRYECPKCGESECDTVMYDNPEMEEQKHILKFKVGDKVHLEGDDVNILTITGIEKDRYLTDCAYGPILFGAEDMWQIVEQKPLHWRRIEDATTQRTDDGCCVTSEKMLVKGWMDDEDYRIVDEGTIVNRDILCIPVRELNAEQKEQKPISFYGHYNPDDYEVVVDGNATSLKKKEQKPAEYIKRNSKEWYSLLAEQYDKGFWKGKAERKPAEWSAPKINGEPIPTENQSVDIPLAAWSEEDEKMLSDLRNTLGCLMNAGAITFKTKKKFSNWLKFLPERFNLQPKQEWSEEDIKKIRSEEYTKGFNDAAFGGKLKEWSVEDEDRIRQIERIAQQAGCTQKLQEEIHDWLKSLRPSWKPSEEQMKALNETVNILAASPFLHQNDYLFNILNGLREELKKLLYS